MLSPRARSLLALASLLAVARAAPDSAHNHNNVGLGGRCVTVTIHGGVDRVTAASADGAGGAVGFVDSEVHPAEHVRVSYDYMYNGMYPLHRIIDHCALIRDASGSDIVLQQTDVTVCNEHVYPGATVGLSPPEVRVVEEDQGKPRVYARCVSREGCGPLSFTLEETCRVQVLPPLPRVTPA